MGSTRPPGCWYGQAARVQPAPKRQGVACWELEVGLEGWLNMQLGRVHARPNRQGVGLGGV